YRLRSRRGRGVGAGRGARCGDGGVSERPDYMPDAEWRSLAHEVETTAGHLIGRHPAFSAHARFVHARLAELAHRAYHHGMSEAYRQLRTSDEAADELGVKRVTILKHARTY